MEGRSDQVRQYLVMATIVTVIIVAAAVAGFTVAMASLHAQEDSGVPNNARASSLGPSPTGLPTR